MKWLTNLWWRFVFWWKQRTGFINLHRTIEVTGTILSLRSSSDGDALLNIQLDAECWWATPLGIGDPLHDKRLHCEIVPWLQTPLEIYRTLKVGDRIQITGDWGFDGVHLLPNHSSKWLFPLEVIAALFRHQPNITKGWFELHPVRSIILLPE